MNNDENSDRKEQLWDQQKGETVASIELFQQFMQLGHGGSLRDIATTSGRSLPAIRQLSSIHHWSERAAAWRQHLAAESCQAISKTTAQNAALWACRNQIVREQEWELSQQCAEAIHQLLENFLEKPGATTSISEINNLLLTFSKLGRPASDQPGDITEQICGPNDGLSATAATMLQQLYKYHRLQPISPARSLP